MSEKSSLSIGGIMANLSDLFPADTKRGRLAELLYQRSIAEPAPVPDIRSTPPQIMGGLLGMIDSAKRKVGKNLSDLVNNPDQYLRLIAERLPETAMKQASDPGNFIPGGGLIAQTAWHGSPHKFAKFQMDKIGTGEGAQAYGHGMYLAEVPEVAAGYKMSNSHGVGKYAIDGKDALNAAYEDRSLAPAVRYLQDYGDTKLAKQYAEEFGDFSVAKKIDELESSGRLVANPKPPEGHLYKTDIPDEAVARFLDWDKPLSQQAGISIKPVSPSYDGQFGTGEYGGYAWHVGDTQVSRAYRTPEKAQMNAPLGSDLIRDLNAEVARPTGHQEILQKAGIPGIRYLDGGSRGAGQGSSNFVIFDPEMIRILERNGEPTGLQPWAPGEYQLRDLLPK